MFHRIVRADATDVSVVVRFIDSTDGTPETGVDHATSGIDMKYRREGAANVDITEAALAALTTAHTDGGMEQIGNGYVRVDVPDAAFAAGVAGVLVHGVATGMVCIGTYCELVANVEADTFARVGAPAGASIAADLLAIDNFVDDLEGRLTSTRAGYLDNLSAGAVATQASLDTIDNFLDTEVAAILAAVDTEVAAILADTGELQTDWADGGRLDLILDARASQTSVNTIDDFLDTEIAAILAAVDTEIASLITAVDTIDNFLDTEIAAIISTLGTPAGASVSADILVLDNLVDDLEGRLTAALATALQAHGLAIGRGVVDASSSTTAVIVKTMNGATASAVDDFYNGRIVIFTSGALTLQATSISDYTGASKTLTVVALTGAPAEDVTFVLV